MSIASKPWAALVVCAAVLYACKSSDPAVVDSSNAASALTVALVSPQRTPLPDLVQGSGSLTAWQEIIIGTETGSYRIDALRADVGAVVHKGQLLAVLAHASVEAELHKQQAALAEAVSALKEAAADAKRAREVTDTGALSPQKVDEYLATEESKQAAVDSARADLESTRIQLSQTRIIAVESGLVSSRSAVLGNVVPAGTELFRLLRDGRVEWRLELDAAQLARVRVGNKAVLRLADGRTEGGFVRLVAPTLNSTTGRGLVYVSLLPGSAAQAGGYAGGSVETGASMGWTLPESAIVTSDGRTYVYTVDAKQKAHRQVVETGRRANGSVEITQGLPSDSRVVASGGGFLSEGANVTIAAASATSATPARLQATGARP